MPGNGRESPVERLEALKPPLKRRTAPLDLRVQLLGDAIVESNVPLILLADGTP
jgi:hypothetical protein